jgi:hypothetical protein
MGYNWNQGRVPGGGWSETNNQYGAVAYGNGRVVRTGHTIAYSDNLGSLWNYIAPLDDSYLLNQIIYGNGKFVSISKNIAPEFSGQSRYFIAYSNNGIDWVKSNIEIDFWLPRFHYSDGKFLINESIRNSQITTQRWAYSDDGINWITKPSLTRQTDITYGNNLFACCINNKFNSSTNGETWNENIFGINLSLPPTGIMYGNNRFIVFGSDSYNIGAVYSNNNGVSWWFCNNLVGSDYGWYGASYANGYYAISTTRKSGSGLGSGPVTVSYLSADGITWAENQNAENLSYSNGIYVGINYYAGIPYSYNYSSDLINWSQVPLPQETVWNSLTFSNNKFISVGSSNVGISSTNGINWSSFQLPTIPGGPSQHSFSWSSSFYVNQRLFAFSSRYEGNILGYQSYGAYSDNNGLTWTYYNIASSTLIVFYKNNMFIGFPNDGNYAYSYDGINWSNTTRHFGNINPRRRLEYGDGKFVLLPSNFGDSNVAYSFNGIDWSYLNSLPAPPPNSVYSALAYGDGKFVAILSRSSNNLPQVYGAYSANGLNWTAINLPYSIGDDYQDIIYADNKFVIISSYNKAVLYSSDGINWVRTTDLPLNIPYIMMEYGNGRLVAIPAVYENRTVDSAFTSITPAVAPLITSGQTAFGKVGTAFTKIFSLTDSWDSPVTSWSAAGLPSWATLNTTTGAITGTPQDSGSTTITLTAEGPGGTDTETATILIGVGPPIITAGQSFTGGVGVAFSQTPALQDALDRPATSWARTSGALPTGLSLNTTTGAITGTPTAKGSFTATFTATGESGTSAATSISFTIVDAPLITAGQTASGKVGTAFSKTFSLTDAVNRPVTSWAATGLPAGLALNTTTGAITGTPQDSGNSTITLTATGPGGSDTKTAVISIALGPPIITAGQSFTGKVGVAFSQTPALDDALDRPATSWARTSGALPTGLSLNTATGAITGTPTAKGSFTALFTATGGGGASTATSLSFTIAEGVPLIVSGQGVSVFLNSYFKRDVALENEANRSVTGWSVSGAAWAQISTAGEIFGTPVDSGDYMLIVTATGPGGTNTGEISVLVRSGSKVVFQVPKFDSPPVPANDILVRGGEYIYGRWTGKGAIPSGINWVGMEEGLRFWGTPTRTGQWEAEFEGPYPANFESDLTQGGSGVPPLRLDAGEVPEEIVVSKFTLQFEAVEQTGYTFGQVLKEIFSNPSVTQTARRLGWSGSRCIGARGLSPAVLESGVAAPVDLSVAGGLSSVAANLVVKINESSALATASWPMTTVSGLMVTITAREEGTLQVQASSTQAGAVSASSLTLGSTTARQVSQVLLSGPFKGGVVYIVTIGEEAFSVATDAKPKAGLWLYAAPANAADHEGATARGIQNGDLTEDDYAAADWVFSEPVVIDRSYGGCLLTGGVGGRGLLDGVKRAVAVNGVISI